MGRKMKNFIILIVAVLFCLVNAYVMASTTTVFTFVMASVGAFVGAGVATLADNNKF